MKLNAPMGLATHPTNNCASLLNVVFFQPPIFDIRIDNLIHKGDRISQPPSNIPPTLYYAPENFALGG